MNVDRASSRICVRIMKACARKGVGTIDVQTRVHVHRTGGRWHLYVLNHESRIVHRGYPGEVDVWGRGGAIRNAGTVFSYVAEGGRAGEGHRKQARMWMWMCGVEAANEEGAQTF